VDATGTSPGLADSLSRLGTETAFSVLARARELERQGREIVHLEIGEPDFDTPEHVKEAATAALRAGETHYCPTAGIPELREEAARYLSRTRAVDIDPARVLVANGAKPFLFFTILATCNPGDEVVYPDPGFPIYESMARYAGGTTKPYAIRQANDFRVDLDELASLLTPRTKLLVLNSPANPTGGVLTRTDMDRIAELVAAHPGLAVLTDEIYGRIVHEGEAVSLGSYPGMADRTITLDGFSKTYAMTGWRLGYAIVPPFLLEAYKQLIINSVSCTSMFSQVAAVEALTGPQDEVEAMVAEFRARRDLIVAGLN